MKLLQRSCRIDELFHSPNFTCFAVVVWITKEQVRRKWNSIAQTPTKDLRNRNTPSLPEDVETRKLDRCQHLRAIVIQRRRRVRDQKSQFLEMRRIASD